jgi:hypothetical protein
MEDKKIRIEDEKREEAKKEWKKPLLNEKPIAETLGGPNIAGPDMAQREFS